MSKNSSEQNTFVLEYQGDAESTEATFNHLIEAISDRSPVIRGFRLELNTADPLDSLFEFGDQTTIPAETAQETADSKSEREVDIASSEDQISIPSLQSDALPERVLSLLCDGDEDARRSSDLQSEFDDENIDTTRISQTLASLKRRELVSARPDPEDNRANIYWATEKGEQALRR